MKRMVLGVGFALFCSVGPESAVAQQRAGCQAPAPLASKQPNIFSEAQENDLGDAVAELVDRDVSLIGDDALTAGLQRIGDRLSRQLPPTRLNIRYALVDLPDANAFVLPGGRVYVSRKLVSFTENEDELAGVLGHELGHLVARQQTLRMTALLRDVLGVTSVGDRDDIFRKYHQLMDNAARRPLRTDEAREEGDQAQADQIGLHVIAAAGYDPQALVRYWDRYAETKGKTGGFFSNLLGATSTDARRLRGLMKAAAAVPAGCVENRAAGDRAAYQDWRAAVIATVGAPRREVLQNVLARTRLEPRHRGEVDHVKFSPDGRFVLAKDDGGITVLSRDPFTPLFHIETPAAERPQFSPDSASVVFHTSGLRVERWSVAGRKRLEVHELVIRSGCEQTVLAPDGRRLACFDGTNLALVDVASGTVIFDRKDFYSGGFFFRELFDLDAIFMGFSPDARYFAAAYRTPSREEAVVYDQPSRATLDLNGEVVMMMAGGFAFTAPDQLIAHYTDDDAKSVRVRFPKAEVTERVKLFAGTPTAATEGNYVMLRPFQKYAVGLMDLARGMVTKANPNAALDVYGDVFVAERGSGELALYRMADNSIVATSALPHDMVTFLAGAAVSPDFRWLALSGRTRGGVWDLTNGTRLLPVRGFRGGFFDERAQLFADFPKTGTEPRSLTRIDLQNRQISGVEIKEPPANQVGQANQVGSVLITVTHDSRSRTRTIEGRAVQEGSPAWKRSFASVPPWIASSDRSDSIVLVWPATLQPARDEARKNPALARQLSGLKDLHGDYFVQALDPRTGAIRGALFIETANASFAATGIEVVEDWVAVEDDSHRVLLYSLATGEQKGHVFGNRAVIAPRSGWLKVAKGEGRVAIYDLAALRRRHDFTFVHDVMMTSFSPDASRLFVLTSDQTAFTIDVSKPGVVTH